MPALSIVVPAYNVGDYLEECLNSLKNQSLTDIEVIVVDDCGSDNCAQIADAFSLEDDRFKVIHHSENKGTHLTRRDGVLEASGDYIFFVDGDDALSEDMCEQLYADLQRQPVDIFHFGLTVIPANNTSPEEVRAFEQFNNQPTPESHGLQILRDIYDEQLGYKVDWRFTQRVYNAALLKQAFQQMTTNRLGRSQDGYECFVVTALAETYRSNKGIRGYKYYYGRGISGTSDISARKFGQYCKHFKADFDATFAFAAQQNDGIVQQCAQGFQHKATEILANDWKVRVSEEEKAEAAQLMADVFGNAITARELYRFIRDNAYKYLQDNNDINVSELMEWNRIAQTVSDVSLENEREVKRFVQMRNKALEHLREVEQQSEKLMVRETYTNQPIRIFVTTHKEVDIPEGHILQPVQVGPKNRRFPWALQDDAGENIADKNPMYCELTTQYWAWKNVDAEYYGFCHYRRYFNFSSTDYKENAYGEIMDDYIDAKAIAKYGLDDQTMRESIEGYDVITTRFGDLRTIIDGHGTPKVVWEAAPKLIDEDLHRMYDIVCEMQPEYKQDAITFLNGHQSCFCNMFIMRKTIFQDYCAWLFPLLEEFERRTDMSLYSKEALRTPGHLAERLLNIYLLHHKRIGSSWKTKELQCVHFTSPEPQEQIEELLGIENPASIVPVVFAADDNYVPQLATTMYSAMSNADTSRFYDIVVLQRNITWDKQQRLKAFFKQQFNNMELRFINVDRLVSGVDLSTNNAHISVETYYRFLIQEVLPFYNKVLYLDSDIVINGNIAELFDTELGDNLLAAVHDIDFLGNLNMKDGKRLKYNREVLGMKNPYEYFQAGVLVLNTKAMREQYSIAQWLTFASNPEYIYNDQDVLNVHCEGKVTFLDWNWNVMHDCANRVANVFSYAPNDAFDAYQESRQNPLIIHYAGFEKPWKNPDCDFASYYWRYARQTPFYERLIKKIEHNNALVGVQRVHHENAIGEGNPIRKIIDPIAPLGSPQREAAKAIVRTLRGRK